MHRPRVYIHMYMCEKQVHQDAKPQQSPTSPQAQSNPPRHKNSRRTIDHRRVPIISQEVHTTSASVTWLPHKCIPRAASQVRWSVRFRSLSCARAVHRGGCICLVSIVCLGRDWRARMVRRGVLGGGCAGHARAAGYRRVKGSMRKVAVHA